MADSSSGSTIPINQPVSHSVVRQKAYDERFHIFGLLDKIYGSGLALILVLALYAAMILGSHTGLLLIAVAAGITGFMSWSRSKYTSLLGWAVALAAVIASSSAWFAVLVSVMAMIPAAYLTTREMVIRRDKRLTFEKGELALDDEVPWWTLKKSEKFAVNVTIETTVELSRPWWMLKMFNCAHISVDTSVQGDRLVNNLRYVRYPYKLAGLIRAEKVRLRDRAAAPMNFEGVQTATGFRITQILPD